MENDPNAIAFYRIVVVVYDMEDFHGDHVSGFKTTAVVLVRSLQDSFMLCDGFAVSAPDWIDCFFLRRI
ncbi:MAG: hypothetical protein U0T81_10905 [Saprospiraceae bacterium]